MEFHAWKLRAEALRQIGLRREDLSTEGVFKKKFRDNHGSLPGSAFPRKQVLVLRPELWNLRSHLLGGGGFLKKYRNGAKSAAPGRAPSVIVLSLPAGSAHKYC